jgi:hypothetical protein
MKTFPPRLKPSNVRDSLQQHLHMYALAASAAGVSALAMAQPSEAKIIYTPVQVTTSPGQSYGLDLNQDGIVDFTVKNRSRSTTSAFFASIFVQPKAGNVVAAHMANYGFAWAYDLRSGMRITKAERHFSAGRATMAWSNNFLGPSFRGGSWVSNYGVSNRFLGLKFEIDGKTPLRMGTT